MKITRECDYAIRITLMLASLGKGDIADAKTISETQCVPKQFTLKILRELMEAGYVKSFKGAHGGYCLNKTADEISMKDIISAIDGELAINDCLHCGYTCNRVDNVGDCPVHRQLEKVNSVIDSKLSAISFADLLESN